MNNSTAKAQDPRGAIRGFFLLDGFIRLFIWYSSAALTFAAFNAWIPWPVGSPVGGSLGETWEWGCRFSHLVLGFNVIYLAHLLVLRLLIPTPKEGRYTFADKGLRLHLVWAALIATIVRARYYPPFPGFLVFHISNLPPICWLVTWIIGPKSQSCFPLDPPIPDPDFVEIGRNVTIGYSTSLTSHVQDREGVTVAKIVVEDDVMIGAEALIYGGCVIKRGALIYGGSVVRPFTIIGENEAWGGVPARKVKDMPPT